MPSSLNTVTTLWGLCGHQPYLEIMSKVCMNMRLGPNFNNQGQQPWGVGTIVIPILQMGILRPRDVEMKCLISLSGWLKQVPKSGLWELQAHAQARLPKALPDTFSQVQDVSAERTTPKLLCFLPRCRWEN